MDHWATASNGLNSSISKNDLSRDNVHPGVAGHPALRDALILLMSKVSHLQIYPYVIHLLPFFSCFFTGWIMCDGTIHGVDRAIDRTVDAVSCRSNSSPYLKTGKPSDEVKSRFLRSVAASGTPCIGLHAMSCCY